MKILESWLKQYIDYTQTPEQIGEALGNLGLEVAGIDRPGKRYDGFVVGHVLDVQKHPNADKLSVCTVDTGKETRQIVCGAPNVAVGQKVPVGLPGATVPKNQHDPAGAPFVLSVVKLRGVESSGMICSEKELDLGSDGNGIMVLDPHAKAGTPLAKYFGLDDVVIEVEITPNRPDWLSHLGVAREIGVIISKQAKLPHAKPKEGTEPVRKHLALDVKAKDDCPRFAARMITGVKIGPSPKWLQDRLRAIGLRPISTIVDITNFVMYESGQPMHAFDYRLLKGGKIVVRHAEPGATFQTLDGKKHQLPDKAVMVCDAEREVSIAGVMGGENSEINDATVDIVLEAAQWNPSSIRRTAKMLGITTDASQRFERGTDPEGVIPALDRAAALVLELAGGTLLKGTLDVASKPRKPRPIPFRPTRANSLLGTTISSKDMVRYFKRIGVISKLGAKGNLLCTPPSFRVDLEREVDLIEEIARVHGYDAIEEKTVATIETANDFSRSLATQKLRDILIGAGFQEAITHSMVAQKASMIGGAVPIQMLNPENQDMGTLRTSIVPGLLAVVSRNQNFKNGDLRLFEIGHVFRKDATAKPRLVEDFFEEERLAIVMSGSASPRHWSGEGRNVDFFDVKGAVEDLLARLGLDKWKLISYSTSNGLTDKTLAIEIHGSYAGYLGQITAARLKEYDVEGSVFVAELLLSAIPEGKAKHYEKLPRYPRVFRDVAFIVNENVTAEQMLAAIYGGANALLVHAGIFDVYLGKNLPAGKKSLAFSLELLSTERTLTDAEIDAAVAAIITHVEQRTGALIRSI